MPLEILKWTSTVPPPPLPTEDPLSLMNFPVVKPINKSSANPAILPAEYHDSWDIFI
jgi:hypothetical protein